MRKRAVLYAMCAILSLALAGVALADHHGKRQTTYKGWPLYYFAGDKAPGDVLGHAVGNVWFVVNP
ncbi:MAG: hypothetical protein NUW14_01475 [Deltaproteobacteria bacterium]|nr:hypothetical protein [Deltaproteobacteria bacterium]